MSKKQYIGLIVLLLLAGASAFYWYEWRPKEIKKACQEVRKAKEDSFREKTKDITPTLEQYRFIDNYNEEVYKKCLIEKGL